MTTALKRSMGRVAITIDSALFLEGGHNGGAIDTWDVELPAAVPIHIHIPDNYPDVECDIVNIADDLDVAPAQGCRMDGVLLKVRKKELARLMEGPTDAQCIRA